MQHSPREERRRRCSSIAEKEARRTRNSEGVDILVSIREGQTLPKLCSSGNAEEFADGRIPTLVANVPTFITVDTQRCLDGIAVDKPDRSEQVRRGLLYSNNIINPFSTEFL